MTRGVQLPGGNEHMSKTIAVIGSLDTKHEEIGYLCQRLRTLGLNPYLIDASVRRHSIADPEADLSREAVLALGGLEPDALAGMKKSDAIQTMSDLVAQAVERLYRQGVIHGGMAAGGLQNSAMGSAALRRLPMGVPKVLVSAMVNSYLPTQMFTGQTDIIVIPSVADVVGLNSITRTIFDNACAAVAGIVQYGRPGYVRDPQEKLIAISSAGVINTGVAQVCARIRQHGYVPVLFHGVTGGSRTMEDLALADTFDGVLDLDIHDLLVDALGYYVFSECSSQRLQRLANKGLPMVVSLSGMDVVDMTRTFYESGELPCREGRKVFRHSPEIYHVKVTLEEARKGAELLARRLNAFTGPVAVAAPLRGFRDNTQPGEALYDPQVDACLRDTVRAALQPHVQWVEADCNANDPLFADTVVNTWLKML